MQPLYPKISPNSTAFIERDGHQIYVEESGNPHGIAVIYLHGGPGGGSSEDHRRYFDPQKYRIIVFDQRGCGKSTPHASVENNSTWDLVEDIEEIREHFAISHWLVAGGSWGTTLALAYGIRYPHHVLGFILRGIFLGTQEEIDWLYGPQGAAGVFPEYYQEFLHPLNDKSFLDIVPAYHHLLFGHNEIARVAAAKAWSLWESKISALHVKDMSLESKDDTHQAIAMACLENHYFSHQCFLEPNYLIDNLTKISHLPAYIVHGRYDMVCQLKQAWLLAKNWDNAQLQIIPKAGHSGFEAGIIDAMCKAADKMADFIISKQKQ
ncbi:prolyl aminopeptidase [Thalassotalea aquiviva]|uniref:prolyl aminopeptidase n=1 Tax=Thalassotalea aquiviva TaxID=3242415 RepID=UPI00352A1AF1